MYSVLVYGVNTPSRWGCVPPDTEILTADGFKRYDELTKGEPIYTWKDGVIEIQPLNEIVVKEHHGVLHSYRGRYYNQTVTPEHRMLIMKHNSHDCVIKHPSEIFDSKTAYSFPAAAECSDLPDNEILSDSDIILGAFVYTDGSIDMRKDSVHKVSIFKSASASIDALFDACKAVGLNPTMKDANGEFGCVKVFTFYGDDAKYIVDLVGQKYKIDDKFMHMSTRQSNLFLDVWSRIDGDATKFMLQCDNETIIRQIQQIYQCWFHQPYSA